MIGRGLQGTVPLPAGERLVPRGEARPTGQAPSAPGCGHGFTRGRKTEGLRNRREMVGKGPGSWRTDTMRVGGGPQGSNLFHQAGRLTPSRKVENNIAKNISQKIWDLDSLNLNQVISNRDLNPRVRPKGRAAASPPPCGVMDRDSAGETPSALYPPQEAGITLNQFNDIRKFLGPATNSEAHIRIKLYRTRGLNPPFRPKVRAAASPPLWSNGPLLHGGNPIGFVPASRGGVYIKSMG